MGLGIFLGAATKAYNDADQEEFRRKMLERKQAIEDARFAHEQRGYDQEKEADNLVKQGTEDVVNANQQRGAIAIDQDSLKQVLGLTNLNDSQVQQFKDTVANKGDVSGLLKSFKGDPATQAQYQPAQVTSGIPDPSKVVLPAATAPDASPVENARLMQNIKQQPETPQASTFVGNQSQATIPGTGGYQPQTGLSDEQWGNLRHYTGADGKTYITTTAQRAPSGAELAMAHGKRLAQSGNLKNSQLGFQLMTQGAEMYAKEVEQKAAMIRHDTNLSFSDKLAKMVELVDGSSMVPGTARVVQTGDGVALAYQAPGQDKPFYRPLNGKSQGEILSSLEFEVKAAHNSALWMQNQEYLLKKDKTHSEMDVNKAQIGNINAKTANETKEGNWIDARNKSAINAQNANAANAYASAAHTNESTNEMKYTFDGVKKLRGEIGDYLENTTKQSPEKEQQLIVKSALLTGVKSQDFTGVFRALKKAETQMSKADEAQLDSYYKIMQDAVKTDPRIMEDGKRMAATRLSALEAAGAKEGSATWKLVAGGIESPDSVLKNVKPKTAIPDGVKPQPADTLGTGLPAKPVDDRVDVRNDPALVSLYNSIQGLNSAGLPQADRDAKMMTYGKAYNDQLANLRNKYGQLTKLRGHFDQD